MYREFHEKLAMVNGKFNLSGMPYLIFVHWVCYTFVLRVNINVVLFLATHKTKLLKF